MAFEKLLAEFSSAVSRRDLTGFANLFCVDACYDDTFFGPHRGRAAISAMLDRFYVGGEQFAWQFIDPLWRADRAYVAYCFSYVSREPESVGQLMAFEGIAAMVLRDGLIAHYREVIDRAGALQRLGYAPQRVWRLTERYSAQFLSGERLRDHLAWRRAARHTVQGGVVCSDSP